MEAFGVLIKFKMAHLDYHGNDRHFELFQPRKKNTTHYGGYSYKVS
jgi:hypothetical protein